MTLIDEVKMNCSVCGKSSLQPVLMSSNQMGYQDMDTRPSEMYRSTMETWILECPHCGYVASSLDDDLIISSAYLKSPEYKTCKGIEFKSSLAEKFYKQYLIENEKFEEIDSFFAILHCAWACDDAKDQENSKLARKIAIKIVNQLVKYKEKDITDLIVMKADLLRRIGEFDQLIKEYKNFRTEEEILNKIIMFQLEKAQEKDSKCYTLREVLVE